MAAQYHTCSPDERAITILMCTYNGARFLSDQLLSIDQQTFRNWRLVASDDGSNDQTLKILNHFKSARDCDRVSIRQGTRRGPFRNFLQLTCDQSIKGEFFALCDQDDIWEADKLRRALDWLVKIPASVPALYCSRTSYIDAAGRFIGHSRLFIGRPTFANALVENLAGGHTMVFNEATRQLLVASGATSAPAHDWLIYLLVTAAEGAVKYERHPTVRYRLHADNVIGRPAWRTRLDALLRNQFQKCIGENTTILSKFRPYMTDNTRTILDGFSRLRERRSLLVRIWGLYRLGVHRGSFLGNIGLLIAIALRKI